MILAMLACQCLFEGAPDGASYVQTYGHDAWLCLEDEAGRYENHVGLADDKARAITVFFEAQATRPAVMYSQVSM